VKDIDPAGFNFHCPEKRSYVIFDPQTEEENNRLDQLLGAIKLWQACVKKRAARARLSPPGGLSQPSRPVETMETPANLSPL
jgi:hypothetical protein